MANPTQRFYAYIDSLLSLARVAAHFKAMPTPKEQPESGTILHILANGPSLSKVDYTQIEGPTLAVNYFASTQAFQEVQPNYYIIQAPEFWTGGINPDIQRKQDQLLADLSTLTTWPLRLIVPYRSGSFFETLRQANPLIEIIYFPNTPVEGKTGLAHFLFDRHLGMPRPHNVLIPSIMIGIWLGYKRIHLYGADHSWLPLIHVDEDNNALIEQRHFYDRGQTKPKQMHKGGKGKRKLHEILEKLYLSFQAYHTIEKYSRSKGIKIYNCTPGSYIDAFERATNITNQ